jgi:DNA polymerase I-like protein with 3'-5' exonuclease and polymerase domains
MDNFVGYKQLLKDISKVFSTRGWFYSIDNGRLNPRNDYSALNLLIQSAGAIVMKQALIQLFEKLEALGLKYDVDYAFVANVHDEIVLECLPKHTAALKTLAVEAIRDAGITLKLRVSLDGEANAGKNWAEIH